LGHTATSLSQLQTPPWALVNGELMPYNDVRIHISAEALTRALSVFEGVKGYWNETGEIFAVRTPRQHYDRLRRSAALLHIPITFSYEVFVTGLETLASRLLVPDRDLWFRVTLYVTQGHWGEGTAADLIVTAFTQQKHNPDPMRLGVSTWRRASDVALLNDAGRVAETTGACVLIADKGRIISPPTNEGCLDSITVGALEQVSWECGVPFERRPIDRSELLAAEECGIAGTITELTLVEEVDGFHFAQSGLLSELRQRYLQIMRGASVLPSIELLPLIHTSAWSASK
jgi:branched-chain amino acid aminotransferase